MTIKKAMFVEKKRFFSLIRPTSNFFCKIRFLYSKFLTFTMQARCFMDLLSADITELTLD